MSKSKHSEYQHLKAIPKHFRKTNKSFYQNQEVFLGIDWQILPTNQYI